jgi:NAD(P)-dependent dehydrogenase (short-subunit alcohol dehydrogenase family)
MTIRGVFALPVEMLTDDGYDLQFGTNVVGHLYLTKLAMPVLVAAAVASSDGTACVVNTALNARRFSLLDYKAFRNSPGGK